MRSIGLAVAEALAFAVPGAAHDGGFNGTRTGSTVVLNGRWYGDSDDDDDDDDELEIDTSRSVTFD